MKGQLLPLVARTCLLRHVRSSVAFGQNRPGQPTPSARCHALADPADDHPSQQTKPHDLLAVLSAIAGGGVRAAGVSRGNRMNFAYLDRELRPKPFPCLSVSDPANKRWKCREPDSRPRVIWAARSRRRDVARPGRLRRSGFAL